MIAFFHLEKTKACQLKSVVFLMQFIYVNQSFAPSPDQEVGTLYEVIAKVEMFSFHLFTLETNRPV